MFERGVALRGGRVPAPSLVAHERRDPRCDRCRRCCRRNAECRRMARTPIDLSWCPSTRSARSGRRSAFALRAMADNLRGGLPTVAHALVGKRERRVVRKGGFEPPRSCDRQPLKLEAVNVDRSRPRKFGVGCSSSSPIEAVSSRRETTSCKFLQWLSRTRSTELVSSDDGPASAPFVHHTGDCAAPFVLCPHAVCIRLRHEDDAESRFQAVDVVEACRSSLQRRGCSIGRQARSCSSRARTRAVPEDPAFATRITRTS